MRGKLTKMERSLGYDEDHNYWKVNCIDLHVVVSIYFGVWLKWVAKPGPGRDFRNWKPGFCWFLRKYSFVLHEICRITLLHLFLSSLKFLSSQNEFFNIYYRLSLSKWLKWVASPGYTFWRYLANYIDKIGNLCV